MKVVLFVPNWYRQDPKYQDKLYGDGSIPWLRALGESILRGLAIPPHPYATLPGELAVEVEWFPDQTNPNLGFPTLLIETEGNTTASHVTLSQNALLTSVVVELGRSGFIQLMPDCRPEIVITFPLRYGPINQ